MAANDALIARGTEELADLESARDDTSKARDQLLEERARLESDRSHHQQVIDGYEADLAAAVSDGHLRVGELAAEGLAGHRQTSAVLDRSAEELVGSRAELDAQRDTLDAKRKSTRSRAGDAGHRADERQREHDLWVAASSELAAHPRLVELAQSDEVDLDRDGPALVGRLIAAVNDIEAVVVDQRVDGAEDERALDALNRFGLLPARRAVVDLVTAIGDLDHQAWSGWTYLAERIEAADHEARIARHPDIVDGVVVYDDPQAIADSLAESGYEASDIVAIARASELAGDAGSPRVVVGPSPARHDPGAAEAELAARRGAVERRQAIVADLQQRRSVDLELRDRLDRLLKALPDGGLAVVATELSEAIALAAQREGEADAAERAVVEHDQEAARISKELVAVEQRRTTVAVSIAITEKLAARHDNAYQPAVTEMRSAASRLVEAEQELSAAGLTLSSLQQKITTVSGEIAERRRRSDEWRSEASTLPSVDGVAERPAETLDVLRARVHAADSALRDVLDDASLSQAIAAAETTVKEASKRLQRFQADEVGMAESLVGTPDASDEQTRHQARQRAEHDRDRAATADTLASRAVTDAEQALRAARPEDEIELKPRPADTGEARERAATADATAADLQRQEVEAQGIQDRAEAAEKAARDRAGILGDQADKLRSVEPAPVGSGYKLPADPAAIRRQAVEVADQLETASASHAATVEARTGRIDALIRFVGGDDRETTKSDGEHGQAIAKVRAMMLGGDVVSRVAPNAVELAVELRDRADKIADQLERIDVHKANVVARLGELVASSLRDLARVSRLSELPSGIGPWAGRQFIRVGERGGRPSPEQVGVRIGELVDAMVVGGRVEVGPVELVWRATEAAVGPKGFQATILKPSPEQASDYVPVADMNKWSGGETLTASLLIFCVMARLRAENRQGGNRAWTHAGVVPLDNPVGKANYREFLWLQRRVAAATGAQLVFWTGIGDLGAVTTFPRIVAMRKSASAARPGMAYVGQDDDRSQRVRDELQAVQLEVSAAARAEQGVLDL